MFARVTAAEDKANTVRGDFVVQIQQACLQSIEHFRTLTLLPIRDVFNLGEATFLMEVTGTSALVPSSTTPFAAPARRSTIVAPRSRRTPGRELQLRCRLLVRNAVVELALRAWYALDVRTGELGVVVSRPASTGPVLSGHWFGSAHEPPCFAW